MLNFMPKLKLDKDKGEGGGGSPPDESKEDPAPPAGDPPPKEEGDNLDEHGYEKVPKEEGDKEKAGDPPKEDPAPKEIKDPATGYGDEPPKPEDPPKEDPPPKPDPDELDPVVEGLPKEEADKIKDFVKKHGVTKDHAKAFADLRKVEIAEAEAHFKKQEKEFEQQKIRIRAEWHKELKEDPAFGGENFKKNVSDAEKVLAEHMPQTKKSLTERKAMLPPYLMRDLAKLAKHLYSTEKLIQGEPKTPKEDEKVVDEALDFYS